MAFIVGDETTWGRQDKDDAYWDSKWGERVRNTLCGFIELEWMASLKSLGLGLDCDMWGHYNNVLGKYQFLWFWMNLRE